MKRLTISMSDALFDKLNQVENKSLFIRKLIEGELCRGLDPSFCSDSTYESLEGGIEDLQHEIQLLSSRLASIENQISFAKVPPSVVSSKSEYDQMAAFPIISPESIAVANENGISCHSVKVPDNNGIINEPQAGGDGAQVAVFSDVPDIRSNLPAKDDEKSLPANSDEINKNPFCSVINVNVKKELVPITKETKETPIHPTLLMPDAPEKQHGSFQLPVENAAVPSIIMPDLSDVLSPSSSSLDIASPEPCVPSSPLFIMPDLSDVAESSSASLFDAPPSVVMPSSENDMQMLSLISSDAAASGIEMQARAFLMPKPQLQSPSRYATIQAQVQNNDVSNSNAVSIPANDLLQGNILMYLPHGARIKRSIIKGLVSRKFSAAEIDAEIDLMVSGRSVHVEVEDGVEYLMRP